METLEAADTGDDGVLSSKNITVAAYVAVPLLAFALLACFCARRRSRDDSARTAARHSWAKSGGSAGLGGLGGHAPRGREAAIGGTLDSSGAGSRKVLPTSSSLSPKPTRKSSRAMRNDIDLEEMNLAGDLVVGGGAAAAAGAGAGGPREKGKSGKAKAKKFAQCGADTAFAMTSSEDVIDDHAMERAGAAAARGGAAYGARGGGESDSSGGAGTGRSSSPAGYEEDDAAASTFEGGSMGRRVEDDDELSENGWGSSYSASHRGPPSYEETQRREQRDRDREAELNGNGLAMRSYSNRERNSERTMARAAAAARTGTGRNGSTRRSDGSRSTSLR